MGKHSSSVLVDSGVANLCSPASQWETNNGGISQKKCQLTLDSISETQASLAAGELVMSQIAAGINLYLG